MSFRLTIHVQAAGVHRDGSGNAITGPKGVNLFTELGITPFNPTATENPDGTYNLVRDFDRVEHAMAFADVAKSTSTFKIGRAHV